MEDQPTQPPELKPMVPSTTMATILTTPELKHTNHTCVLPWVNHLKLVQKDLLDEAASLDNDAIEAEKMVMNVLSAINSKRKRFMWTVENVWSPEEIKEAQNKLAAERQRMGP